MFSKIKAVKGLHDQAKKMQALLADVSVTGEAGWGKAKVSMDGNQKVLSVEIADELMTDKAKLQETVRDAANDAVKKLQMEVAKKMRDNGGLDMLKDMGM